MSGQALVDTEIAKLGDLTRAELVERWESIYRCPPPSGVRRELLTHAIAWDLQAKRFGGLTSVTRNAIKIAGARIAVRRRVAEAGANALGRASADNAPSAPVQPAARSRLRPGARLIREWNGKTNVVDVTTDGFVFENKNYQSLSTIACQITGAHWSGPRFFGL